MTRPENTLRDVRRQLYRERPEDFVAARNRLVRELRQNGERSLASAIAALRRPTVSAWAVNRLHDEAAPRLRELIAAGEDMRSAVEKTLRGEHESSTELRRLGKRHGRLVDELTATARDFLRGAGRPPSEDTVRRVAATLRAASTDPERAPELADGTLPGDLEPVGFGGLEAVPVVAVTGASRADVPERAEEARQRHAQAQLVTAEREAERLARQAARQRDWAEELSRHAAELLEQVRAAQSRARRAQQDASEAEARAQAAHDEVERLRGA